MEPAVATKDLKHHTCYICAKTFMRRDTGEYLCGKCAGTTFDVTIHFVRPCYICSQATELHLRDSLQRCPKCAPVLTPEAKPDKMEAVKGSMSIDGGTPFRFSSLKYILNDYNKIHSITGQNTP